MSPLTEAQKVNVAQVEARRPDLVAHAHIPVAEWLAQFESDGDRAVALRLFESLRFFSLQGVRDGLVDLHRWLLSQDGIELKRTRFTSFAKAKSGALTQYFYRTSNFLHHSLGIDWTELGSASADADTVVIVDDFLGTGREASWYFSDAKEALSKWKQRFFLTLVGYREGLDVLAAEHPEFNLHCLEVHQKLFDPENSAFTAEEKADFERFLRKYGDRVYPPARYGPIATPFGYRDGQALVAYFYNIPSNSLPVFWSVSNGWKPILRRFDSYNVPE